MGLAIELFTNMFQAVMFVGFLYLFFDKPKGKLMRLLPFAGSVLAFFFVSSYLIITDTYISASTYYLDSLIYILIFEAYAIFFLRGKLYLRIIMPIIDFGINTLVSYSFGYIASFISGIPIEESLVASTGFRYFCIAVVNLTSALILWLILRIGSKRIRLSNASEAISFTIIPLMCMVILYCGFFIYQESNFNDSILLYVLISCFVMVGVAILISVMLAKISKANAIKTEYLLIRQKEKLYEESTFSTNMQIKKISGIKHDMKNNLMSIKNLIESGNHEHAINLCDNAFEKLEATYTPINSPNLILNAIINVELEKASSLGINFTIEINETLSHISSADTVSLIGNLCDNAIEYLSTQPKECRAMILQIHSQLNHTIITCKNKIAKSVLSDNPSLTTTKTDNSNHGMGISIIKKIISQYDGEIIFSEENGYFIVSVMLCQP